MIDSALAYRKIRQFLRRHPVRQEVSGERNLEFSGWLREHCRPSKTGCSVNHIELGGMVAYDLDFILYDYKRRALMLLEVKTRNGKVRWSQSKMLEVLDSIARVGAPLVDVHYAGCHVLIMDGLTPFDSEHIRWDDEEISREECWRRVNMLDVLDEKIAA